MLIAMDAGRCRGARVGVTLRSVYLFVSIDRGHCRDWVPSAQYEVEAREFSWADFEQMDAVEEQQLAQTLNADDMMDGDREQQVEMQHLVQQEVQEQTEQQQRSTKATSTANKTSKQRNQRQSPIQQAMRLLARRRVCVG